MPPLIKTVLRLTGHLVIIIFLTLTTQVGGLVWLIVFLITVRLNPVIRMTVFIAAYLIVSVIITPFIAHLSGRIALPYSGDIQPYNYITCLLNRHYVNTQAYQSLLQISAKMRLETGSPVIYLDANFPFIDGFPLLPHLSHSDGRKLDLAFYYLKDEIPTTRNSSRIGYGHYDAPTPGEPDHAALCKKQGFWQYDMLSKFLPRNDGDGYETDVKKTRTLVKLLHRHDATQKIFLEPYLIKRWELDGLPKIRFHGCHAVRHDDHLHWQTH